MLNLVCKLRPERPLDDIKDRDLQGLRLHEALVQRHAALLVEVLRLVDLKTELSDVFCLRVSLLI